LTFLLVEYSLAARSIAWGLCPEFYVPCPVSWAQSWSPSCVV